MWRRIWLAVAVIGLLPTVTMAQWRADRDRDPNIWGPVAGDLEVTLNGSGVNDRRFTNGSFSVGGSFGWFITDELLVALRQNINLSDFDETVVNASTRVALDYHFNLERLRPFVGASVGGVYGDGVRDTWALGLEGGLKYFVHERTFLFGQVEYQWLIDNADDFDDNFRHGQFLYTIGVGFLF